MYKKLILFSPFALLISIIGLNIKDPIFLTLFLMVWMVSWWIFEVIPLGITSLIPLFYLPMTGVMSLKSATPHYANPNIYLFLGGFVIARGLEKTRLNERLALLILKMTGKSDRGIVFGFIIATAFLSMWISNTATTVMMIPIAMSVMNFLKENLSTESQSELKPMAVALFLGIAYAASIGGTMTPIGTPPNVVFIGYLDELFHQKIEFYQWFLITAPVGILILFTMHQLLSKFFKYKIEINKDFQKFIGDKIIRLGKTTSEQKVTLAIFFLVAFLWIFKSFLHQILGRVIFDDTSIAILGGFLLFVAPTNYTQWKPVLDKKDIPLLPWDIVLLFGGGMCMANALDEVGLIKMTSQYFSSMNISSPYALVFTLALITLFMTEVMSNVALCVVFLPVVMNMGSTLNLDPVVIALPATLCASFAFSMPISTPPNAIVFGTQQLKVSDMMKAGIPLNIISVGIVMTVSWFLMKIVL